MIIRPIITYAAAVWCSAAPTNIKPLQVFQNKCLRLILSESRYARIFDIHEKTDIPMLLDYVKELGDRFYRNQLKINELTLDITNIRQNNSPFIIKHKLPYQALPIFTENL